MEGKPADFEYVGFWSRVVATLIDLTLSSLFLAPIGSALYGHSDDLNVSLLTGSPEALLAVAVAMLTIQSPADFLFSFVLPTVALVAFWVARQATPGKMLIHARIVDATTFGKPTSGSLLARYLGYYVGFFSLGLGFFWVGWDPRKQGWHDKLAGTVVIRDKKQ